MKIGILTYYGDLNFGTNLQAYATYCALRKAYPNDEVLVVPFHQFKPRILPYKSLSILSIYRDVKRIIKYRKFKRNALCIKGNDPIIENPIEGLSYIRSFNLDRIYVGADTLLELDRLPVGFDGLSAYWLKDLPMQKIILAGSAKNTEFEKLSKKQQVDMINAIQQMDFVGVRDRSTFKLFKEAAAGDKVQYLPDPTFGYPIDYSHVERYLKKKKLKIPQNSVFIHCYGIDNSWMGTEALKLKANGYTIVTPRPFKWSDIVLNDMSPLEQSGIYRYFKFIITHRFHDCVFSLKNHTPFMVYIQNKDVLMTKDGDSKHISLMKDFDLFPWGFMGCVDEGLSEMPIIERYYQIALRFDDNKIEERMQTYADEYMNFINQTKML